MTTGESALEHRARRRIYDYIYSNPGVSFGTLKSLFDMNKSTLSYHLNYLEKSKKLRSRREGRMRLYFCANQPVLEQKNNNIQKTVQPLTEKQEKLLEIIKLSPGISNKELGIKSRFTPKAIEYNLYRLIEMKQIWKVKTDNGVGYEYITPEKLQREMYNRLLKKLLSEEIDEDTFQRIKQKLKGINLEELE